MNTYDQIRLAAFEDELSKIAEGWGGVAQGLQHIGQRLSPGLKNFGRATAAGGKQAVVAGANLANKAAPTVKKGLHAAGDIIKHDFDTLVHQGHSHLGHLLHIPGLGG